MPFFYSRDENFYGPTQFHGRPFFGKYLSVGKEREALLIDPGFYTDSETNVFEQTIKQKEASLIAILLTHSHVDHVLGLRKILQNYSVPVYLSNEDRYLWNNLGSQAKMFGLTVGDFDFEPEALLAQKDWSIGPFSFDLLRTPGHSPDHISFYNKDEKMLIAGDTLFKEGIGRTDLYKGSFELLDRSIREQLYTLPDDTNVYAGHGPPTTIGHEKQANPFVSKH